MPHCCNAHTSTLTMSERVSLRPMSMQRGGSATRRVLITLLALLASPHPRRAGAVKCYQYCLGDMGSVDQVVE